MKRRLHIGIRSREGSYEAALHALQRVEAGDTKQSPPGLFFESIEDLHLNNRVEVRVTAIEVNIWGVAE